MQGHRGARTSYDATFTAHPEEVARLRRVVRLRLTAWGHDDLVDAAQLCVSELVSNIVTHVGTGTPGSLVLSEHAGRLRIEVHDPDTRALPTLVDAEVDAEGGRGMALVDAMADRWGVRVYEDHKVTWCEFVVEGTSEPTAPDGEPSVERADALLDVYVTLKPPAYSYDRESGRVRRRVEEESVIDMVTDLLHRLRAHGGDVERVLDCAQSRLEGVRRPWSP
ncbi:ATP-binding protein [Streptomyces sp. MA15]|uniref:ATP-binding protein n=1 Tax=Streptomyces sp. MA15 TaxID=3055061 RepID=UPI0025B26B28|nr:ATP-binding protein [Streptomyces sp. MA15]MDN3269197.1 ATP-binding protein [Streptomyces sp. MA15]